MSNKTILLIIIPLCLCASIDRALTPTVCTLILTITSLFNIVTGNKTGGWVQETRSSLEIASASLLTIAMIGWVDSTKTYLYLLAPCLLWVVSLRDLKKVSGILEGSIGPCLAACYCLWIAIATEATSSPSNPQVLYYLNIIALSIVLTMLIKKEETLKAMLWTMALIIAMTTWQRLLGNMWWDLPLVITYKNFVAVVGLLVLGMLMSCPKTPANTGMMVISTLALLFNPSVLGQTGAIILWAALGWSKIPNKTKQSNSTPEQIKNNLKIYKYVTIAMLVGIVVASIWGYKEISHFLEKGDSLNGRIGIWKVALDWSGLSPIFGNGILFWFENGAMAVSNKINSIPIRAYNGLLDPAVQSGWIATILLMMTLLGSIAYSRLTLSQKSLLLLSVGLSMLTETHSLTGVPIDMGEAALGTWLAFLWAHSKKDQTQTNSKI
jgi:hypothetical protein